MSVPSRSSLCVLLSIVVGSSSAWARGDKAEPHFRFEVLLTTAPSLPADARASMMTEAAAIWRNQGLAIDWLPPTTVLPVSRNRLRVLVVDRRQPAPTQGKSYTIGELLRPLNGHHVAIMSVESAQHLVASVRGLAGYELIVVDHRRLGLVLGRALAHEIGHYLLDTHTHAKRGLMRPHFNALEFTDLRDGTFVLDRAASAWLRTYLDLAPTFDRLTEHGRFAYSHDLPSSASVPLLFNRKH